VIFGPAETAIAKGSENHAGLHAVALALRLLSAILGGYGIFCLITSFAVPKVGAQALYCSLQRPLLSNVPFRGGPRDRRQPGS
jgi:hypothetical protein